MQTAIAKWGNSLALRLPRALAASVHLTEGSAVELHIEGNSLVVTPSRPRYRLDDLLAGVTPQNRHAETDWGPAQGEEAW